MKLLFIGVNTPAKTDYSFTHDDADIGRVTIQMGDRAIVVRDDVYYHLFNTAKSKGQAFFKIDWLELSMTQGYKIEERLL